MDTSLAHLELYVHDAVRSAAYFAHGWGFAERAQGLAPDRWSILLVNGHVRLIVTEPRRRGAVSLYLDRHGEGVSDIALCRVDVAETRRRAAEAGLAVTDVPQHGEDGHLQVSRIGGLGSVHHTLFAADQPELPPGREWSIPSAPPVHERQPPAMTHVDHLAVCLRAGALPHTVEQYRHVFGGEIVHSEYVSVADTGMDSRVLRTAAGLTYVMAEPDSARRPGQIDQFLAAHRAPGIQHVAFATDDIVATVCAVTARGVDFCAAPPAAYYARLAARTAGTPGLLALLPELAAAGVLLDTDADGNLLQIFTRSPHTPSALFYELVERQGHQGFGTNNIEALFESLEADLASPPLTTPAAHESR